MSDTMEWFLFDVAGTILAVSGAIVFLWVLSREIPRKLDDLVLLIRQDSSIWSGCFPLITIFLIILGLYLIDVYFLQ